MSSYPAHFAAAWEMALCYLQLGYRANPPRFIQRLIRTFSQVDFPITGTSSLRLVEVIAGAMEATDWERRLLCEITNRWIFEDERAAILRFKFINDLQHQRFLS